MRFFRLLGAVSAIVAIAASGPLAQAQTGAKTVTNEAPSAGHTDTGAGVAALRNAPGAGDEIQADPAIRRGVLPNGMRYAVMQNGTPEKAVSLRLVFDVGSFEETDAERGVAHFVEHMAFNGTKNFREDQLDRAFAPAGVQFGRDHNASTGLYTTTYMLDLPSTEAGKLDLAFKWLRDVADGISFDETAVARERGVVVSEHDASLSPTRDVALAFGQFLGKGLRTPTRDPIGTRESIANMQAATLKGFYEKWYRPEHATLVIVGDAPAAELEQRVTAAFGSWQGKGPKPVRATPGKPPLNRSTEVLVRSEPTLPTFIAACKVTEPDPRGPLTMAALRRQLEHDLWTAVLNERLTALVSTEKPPFWVAGVSYEAGGREAASTCLTGAPLDDDWPTALNALNTEMRRFIAHGPTQEELERAKESRRAMLRGAVGGQATRPTPDLANFIMVQESEGWITASPDEAARVYERAVSKITAETLRARAAADWSGSGPLLVVTAPKSPEAGMVSAAWSRSDTAAVPPQVVPPKAATWTYTRFGAPGRVVKRETIDPPGFTRLTFANGVVVNFKQTKYAVDRVTVRVRFGAGRGGLAPGDLFTASIGSDLLVEGGLGKIDADSMRRIFSDRGWGAELHVLDDAFVFEGLAASNGLESQLQILAAYLTDPGFRPILDSRLPTAIESVYRFHKTDPGLVLGEALNNAIEPGNPLTLPSRERLSQVRTRDFERLFKRSLLESPLEITIVGDVSEAEATMILQNTFGALPRRQGKFERRPDSWWLRYPAEAPPVIRATHEGPKEKAVVAVVWPLYVADPKRRQEEFSLNLVASVLDFMLRHRIREELGKSYAPSASIAMPDFGDQGAITVYVETSPGDAEAVAREIQETGLEVARGGFDQATLDAVRFPFLEERRQARSTNEWWLHAMDGSAKDGTNLNDFLTIESIFTNLTLADVKKAAAKWLVKRPIVAVVTPASAAGTVASAGASGG